MPYRSTESTLLPFVDLSCEKKVLSKLECHLGEAASVLHVSDQDGGVLVSLAYITSGLGRR